MIRAGGGKCVARGWQLIWRLRKLRLGDIYFHLTWPLFLTMPVESQGKPALGESLRECQTETPNCVLI